MCYLVTQKYYLETTRNTEYDYCNKRQEAYVTRNHLCPQCGKANRLVGIEPHDKFTNLELLTFECAACGNLEVMSQLAPAETAIEATSREGLRLN